MKTNETFGAAIGSLANLTYADGYKCGWRDGLQAGIAAAKLLIAGATSAQKERFELEGRALASRGRFPARWRMINPLFRVVWIGLYFIDLQSVALGVRR